jgi:hypothetical protein
MLRSDPELVEGERLEARPAAQGKGGVSKGEACGENVCLRVIVVAIT